MQDDNKKSGEKKTADEKDTPDENTLTDLVQDADEEATSSDLAQPGDESADSQRAGDQREEDQQTEPQPAENPLAEYIRELEELVREKDRRVDEVLAAYRASQVETTRIRERLDRDREKRILQDKVRLFGRVLDPLDNLERCLAAARQGGDMEGLRDGVGMVHRQLQDAMFSLGLKRVDPTGQKFDPEQHEALSVAPVTDEEQHDVVIQCVQPGYVLEDQMVRVARVIVGKKS